MTTRVRQDLAQYSWDLARLAWSLPGLGVQARGPYRPRQQGSVGKSPIEPAPVAAVGAASDALAGQSAFEAVNLAAEDSYWSANYLTRCYVERGRPYADYRPAYRYGWESRALFGDRLFHEVESELGRGWDRARGVSKLCWTQAQFAAGDAWRRVGRAICALGPAFRWRARSERVDVAGAGSEAEVTGSSPTTDSR